LIPNTYNKKAKKYAESAQDEVEVKFYCWKATKVIKIVFCSTILQLIFALISIIWFVVQWRVKIVEGKVAYSLSYNASMELHVFDSSSALFTL
jgi:hypothetical protein